MQMETASNDTSSGLEAVFPKGLAQGDRIRHHPVRGWSKSLAVTAGQNS